MTHTRERIAPPINIWFVVLMGAAACWFSWYSTPHPALLIAIGAASGLLAGTLRRKSIQSAPEQFSHTTSGMGVTRAFASNLTGKLSIAVLGVTLLGFVAIAVARGGEATFGAGAGMASFVVARDIVALPTLRAALSYDGGH